MKKIVLMSFIVVAFFANAETTYEGRLEETVVLSQVNEELNRNQIANTTIITKEEIENKGYNTVDEILKNASGVNFYSTTETVIDIRGQGKHIASKRVKIMVDGLPLNVTDVSHSFIPLNSIPVENIERIEIINGGDAVLYGGGTEGGVINIITNRVRKEGLSGNVYYQNSSYDTNKFGLNVNYNISNKLIFSTGFERIVGDGYSDKETLDVDAFNFGAIYNIDEKQSLRFNTRYYYRDYVKPGSLTEAQLNADRKQSGNTTPIDYSFYEYSLGYSNQLTDNFKFGLNGYIQKINTIRSMTIKDTTKSIAANGDYSYDRGNVLFGYEYSQVKIDRQSSSTKLLGNQMGNSFYALNRYNLTNNLDLVGGYRYTHYRNHTFRTSGTRELNANKNGKSYAYELGLNYRYSDSGSFYSKIERGYRHPNIIEMVNTNNGIYFNDVVPETYNTYEIGVKDYLFGSYISATTFYTITKNEINSSSSPHNSLSGSTTYTNLKETERKGIELFAEQYFGKLRINESYTYVNAKISKGEYKGNKITYVVPTKITLGAVYDFTDKISVNGNLNYYSNSVDNAYKKIKHYTTVDLGATFKVWDNVKINAGIKNVFDKKYNLDQSTSTSGVTSYLPADERTYYIGFSYSF